MIIWNISPIMLQLGSWEIRWYGLMFALSLWLGQQILYYIWHREGKNLASLDVATFYLVFGTLIGARLGNVLFYDFDHFSQRPLEIFLPVTFTPTFKFIGYQGLASHGAAIGILLAVYIYINYVIKLRIWPFKLTIKKQRREGQTHLWFLDRLVIVVALAGCFIRIGNFMNSEIIGKPTHSQYGVLFVREVAQQLQERTRVIDKVTITKNKTLMPDSDNYQPVTLDIAFKHGFFEEKDVRSFLEKYIKRLLTKDPQISSHIAERDDQPLRYELSKNRKGAYIAHINTFGIFRHPAQLYESLSCFILFLFLFYRWYTKQSSLRSGETFGLFLVIVFGLRFFYEFLKPGKIVFTNELVTILMPQLLSIPLIIMGLLLLMYSRRASKRSE